MALYTAPTIVNLIAKVRRVLRDSGAVVFTTDQIVDFINFGLGELSAIRPLETVVDIDAVAELATGVVDLDYVWSVEAVGVDGTSAEGAAQILSPDDPGVAWRNGWDLVGGTLVLPAQTLKWFTDVRVLATPTHILRVSGYRHRRRIDSATTSPVDLFSLPEEEGVTALAQEAGFEALMNDRALFQQWQTATHATDVSPTQITNMVYGAQSKWERMRKHLYLIRRPVQGAQ